MGSQSGCKRRIPEGEGPGGSRVHWRGRGVREGRGVQEARGVRVGRRVERGVREGRGEWGEG